MVEWTLTFETNPGHPLPTYSISGASDYVLGFAASTLSMGWKLIGVQYISKGGSND